MQPTRGTVNPHRVVLHQRDTRGHLRKHTAGKLERRGRTNIDSCLRMKLNHSFDAHRIRKRLRDVRTRDQSGNGNWVTPQIENSAAAQFFAPKPIFRI